MSLNRAVEPPIEIPSDIYIPHAEKHMLQNGIPMFYIHAPNQDVLKIEIVFNAGNLYEPMRLVAGATNDLLDDGTKQKNARQIAAHFDFYGASIQTECGPDRAAVTLFTLGKFLKETLPLLSEIINEPVFPEDELQTYKVQHRQKLAVSNKKVEFVARKTFAQEIFGLTHPYGYYATEQDYELLNTAALTAFHRLAYLSTPPVIIVSGLVNDTVRQEIDHVFGSSWTKIVNKNESLHATRQAVSSSTIYSEKPDALQSAIRIGRKMFNKTHPDYTGLSILNTILGGYFGSRLMSNIREDKGYTYGIGSALVSLQQAGYFFIATEVGTGVTKDTLKEIYSELARLQEEPVTNEELKTVKNFLAGAFLRSIDGPFAQADKWKGINFFGLDYTHYERYLETLRNITAEALRGLACKYLNKKDLTEVVVGKK